MLLRANKDRIYDNPSTLSTFNSCLEREGMTRALSSEAEIGAHSYVRELMTQAGLLVTEGAIGSISGILVGSYPDLASVRSGSYIDTVRDGGMHDGMVGVVSIIEACRITKESNISHQRNITVLIFTLEEPTRHKLECIGNRVLISHFPLEETKSLVDENGVSLYDGLNWFGYTEADYSKVMRRRGNISASTELRVEQTPVLEQPNCPAGIVEAICAPTYISVVLGGQQEHAGSTPMNARHDAMTATCKVVLKMENLARNYENNYTVATVERMLPSPNLSNVTARRVEFSIGTRDINEDRETDMT